MTKDEFLKSVIDLGIDINEEVYSKLYKYYEELNIWNNKFNMTNILKEEDVFLLHFYDSLCLTKSFDFNKKISLCDFGTGAGFPGLVLAILFNNISVTLVESNQKKCGFLEYMCNELNLNNVNVVCSRIEDYSRINREKFDIVTCRAVTSIPMIIELSTSSIKVGGYLMPLKSDCEEEVNKYKYLLKDFNLELESIIKYNLPINDAVRMIPKYKKINITNNKYPRNYSTLVKMYKNK